MFVLGLAIFGLSCLVGGFSDSPGMLKTDLTVHRVRPDRPYQGLADVGVVHQMQGAGAAARPVPVSLSHHR
jgi:hypothetical protein